MNYNILQPNEIKDKKDFDLFLLKNNLYLDCQTVIFCVKNKEDLPELKEVEASCYDIGITTDQQIDIMKNKKLKTGIKCFLTKGLKLNLYTRSSTFDEYGLILANGVGKIESSYRAEILANCIRLQDKENNIIYSKKENQKIRYFQLEIENIINHLNYNCYVIPVLIYGIVNETIYDNWSDFLPSNRGEGGFGSTGI